MGALQCFGTGEGKHVGLSFIFKDDDNLCVIDPDQQTYHLELKENIYGIFRHDPSIDHLNRRLTLYIDGKESGHVDMGANNTWVEYHVYWNTLTVKHSLQWILIDRDTGLGLGNLYATIKPILEEPEEPEEPIAGDLTDYERIQKAVEWAVNESTTEIVDEILRVREEITGLSGEIEVCELNVIKEVGEGFEEVKSGFAKVTDRIKNLKFPTIEDIKNMFLSLAEEFAEALWDRILDRIERRYEK